MSLCLPEEWLWDFWLVCDGPDYHVFYLKAPRSLGDPEQRHWNATIGHAVSADLKNWSVLPDVLGPGASGDWDDYTTWTGSVIAFQGRWAMLYTGTSRSERGLIQRIGLAWSDDLMDWQKAPTNPVLEHDASRYEVLDESIWPDQAWRDPWVFVDPADGKLHVLLTARVQEGVPAERGVVAHAVSADLRRWTVLDPITNPGVFGQLIPQLVEANGEWFLFFSTAGDRKPSSVIGETSMLTGTHYLRSAVPTGPFDWASHGVLVDPLDRWYGAKVVRTHDGQWAALAWNYIADDGNFAGTLSDPMQIDWDNGPRVRHLPASRVPKEEH